MRWKKLFTPVESLDADQAKTFMEQHKEGTYTLLDVRQPSEYEEGHLPGATLIPLPQLTDRMDELDPGKPVITYCAVGGRSRAAGQLLSGKGFDEVYNLKGGIKAWEDRTAEGPAELGEVHLTGDETVKDMMAYLYAMEAGLEKFYRKAAQTVSDTETAALLKKLSGIETLHKDRLLRLFKDFNPEPEELAAFESASATHLMEGGFDIENFLNQNRSAMQTVGGVLDIAMMLETHGLDLYLRYARQARTPEAQKILFDLAGEEKAHLKALGELLEKKVV